MGRRREGGRLAGSATAASELAEIFRSLGRQRRSGTLKVSDGAGRALYLYFRRGDIQMARARRARTPIGRALIKRLKITEHELEGALQMHRRDGLRLGQCCQRLGLCNEGDVREALVFQAIEEVSDVFTWTHARSEFHRGEPPLDIFDFPDLELDLGLKPEALVREARRRARELVRLKRQIPSFSDIYAPSPEALYAMRSPPPGSPEEELLRHLNGVRDVAEVLDATRLSELDALGTLVRLIRQSEVVALTPQQLTQVASESERVGQLEKAHRLYLRAEAAGLLQLDLPNRIAKLADRLGRREEAVARYLEFAERCRQEDLPEAAVAAYHKALELDPGSVQATEEIVSALSELGEPNQAVRILKQVAEHGDPEQDADKLQRCWQEVLRLLPEDADALEGLGELFATRGDKLQAVTHLGELAAVRVSQGDHDAAIEALRRMLQIDPDCTEARLQLGTTLARVGRKDEAVAAYEHLADAMAQQAELGHSLNWTFLIDIYERIVAVDAGHVRARQWLAQAYHQKAESDKAIGNYAALVTALRQAPGQEEALADALAHYVRLQPDDFAAREEHTELLETLGKVEAAASALVEAREAALKARRFDVALRSAERLVKLRPYDVDANREVARLSLLDKDEERAFLHYSRLARLCELGGQVHEAAEACQKALDLRNDPDLRRVLARVLEQAGTLDEAAKAYLEVGRVELEEENYGLAQEACERAVELDTKPDAARDLLYLLETRRSAAGQAAGWDEPARSQPSITGGNAEVTIVERPQRTYGSVAGVASKLRALTGGGGGSSFGEPVAAGGSEPEGAAALPDRIDQGVQLQKTSGGKRALGALQALQALKGGGKRKAAPPPPSDAMPTRIEPGDQLQKAPGGKKALGALQALRALKGGKKRPKPQPSPDGTPTRIEQGDQLQKAPGGKKALGALQALKALKGGKKKPKPQPSPDGMPSRIEQGDELQKAPGGKKALGALQALRALKGGKKRSAPRPASDSMPDRIDQGDQLQKAPGGKKALGALQALKALKGRL